MAKWTLAKCKEIARKYKRRSDFQRGDRAAEGAARYHGWMEEVCAHMEPVPERIKKRAKAGTWTRGDDGRVCKGLHVTVGVGEGRPQGVLRGIQPAHPQGDCWRAWLGVWLSGCDFLCASRALGRSPQLHERRTAVQDPLGVVRAEQVGAYNSALKNKWMDICCWHMKPVIAKPTGYWQTSPTGTS